MVRPFNQKIHFPDCTLTELCLGAVRTFHETSSPELDALLAKFRLNIFLPAHLIDLQKDLVYKRKNWGLLTNPDEPATVRMGNEVFQLHPLDRTKDEPNTRRSFDKILALMGESADWTNLPDFLGGLKTARRKIEGALCEKLVRKANEAGQMGIILDCLRRVEDTELGLWNIRVAREVMWGATARAVQGEWSQEAIEKGVKYAENVWEMMWDPRHAKPDVGSPRAQPEILGILVQMHAAKAALFGEGKDEVGAVQRFAALMLKHWGSADLRFEEGDWHKANYVLVMWSPVWHGMKMARKLLGEETPLGKSLVHKVEQELEPLLRKAQIMLEEAAPESRKRRGLIIFEELSNVPSL